MPVICPIMSYITHHHLIVVAYQRSASIRDLCFALYVRANWLTTAKQTFDSQQGQEISPSLFRTDVKLSKFTIQYVYSAIPPQGNSVQSVKLTIHCHLVLILRVRRVLSL